ADAIRRFAPVASGVAKPRRSEAVSLLLATDLLSEGVNLQDAAVVVHLDLPWTPARMEQRLGRIARMGSRHSQVYSYAIRPPVSAEALIRIESVLREKMKTSGIVVDEFQSLASLAVKVTRQEHNSPRVTEAVRSILESWSQTDVDAPTDSLAVATVIGNIDGFISLCAVNGRLVLLTRDEAGITSDPDRTLRMLPQCNGVDSIGIESDYGSVIESIERHFHGLEATDDPHRPAIMSAPSRRGALRRLSAIASRSRPHERATVMRLAARARESLWSRIGAHGERQLATIAADDPSDAEWLWRVAELGGASAKRRLNVVVRAIVLFRGTYDSKA
ncbi:MAG: helicase-related protein, partial [Gemmatimonadales bacterium]